MSIRDRVGEESTLHRKRVTSEEIGAFCAADWPQQYGSLTVLVAHGAGLWGKDTQNGMLATFDMTEGTG